MIGQCLRFVPLVEEGLSGALLTLHAIGMHGDGLSSFIEQLWRSVKDDEGYLRAYDTVG